MLHWLLNKIFVFTNFSNFFALRYALLKYDKHKKNFIVQIFDAFHSLATHDLAPER
jgi:hypothetical protein